MSEQKRYINITAQASKALGKLCFIFIAVSSLFLSACMPTGNENVNTELFKDKDDLKQRAASLKPGIGKDKAFELLGVDPDKCQRMSLSEVQSSIYGNAQVQGSPEQLEDFRQRMMRYEGYALPYRFLKSDSSLGFGTMKVHKTGQDLRIVLIFDREKLMRAAVEGTENVSQQNNRYLWTDLISKGIGLAF